MKTITTTAIVLSLALAAGGAMATMPKTEISAETPAAASPSGSNSGCLDFLVLWAAEGEHSPVGDSERVDDVTPDSEWAATSGDGTVWIDFYDADGAWLIGGPDGGNVPAAATYAYGCVVVVGDWPNVPVPGASFTYEDDL